jgi:hypothetical protein
MLDAKCLMHLLMNGGDNVFHLFCPRTMKSCRGSLSGFIWTLEANGSEGRLKVEDKAAMVLSGSTLVPRWLSRNQSAVGTVC